MKTVNTTAPNADGVFAYVRNSTQSVSIKDRPGLRALLAEEGHFETDRTCRNSVLDEDFLALLSADLPKKPPTNSLGRAAKARPKKED